LGSAILVPVWGESTRHLLGIAGKLAAPDGGLVLAASLATELAPESELKAQRQIADKAQEWLAKEGLESRSVFRVSSSISEGLLQTVRGEDATMLLTEWQRGHADLFDPGGEAFGAMRRSHVPILLAHGDVQSFERVVIVARRDDFAESRRPNLELAVELATRLEHDHHVVFVGMRTLPLERLFAAQIAVDRVDTTDPMGWVKESAPENDLLIFCGLDAAREALGRSPGLLTKRFLVAIAPPSDARQPHPEASDAFVAGRSLAEGPAR